MIKIAAVLLVAVVGFGQGAEPAMKSLQDSSAGFTYRYPAYFQVQPNSAAVYAPPAMRQGGTAQGASCLSLPLDARHHTAKVDEVLSIADVDFGCLGKPVDEKALEQVMKGMADQALLNYFATPQVGTPQHYELAGYKAVFAESSAVAPRLGPGMKIYGGTACVLVGQRVVCWKTLSEDRDRMRGWMRGPVVFAGKPAVGVVPDSVLGK